MLLPLQPLITCSTSRPCLHALGAPSPHRSYVQISQTTGLVSANFNSMSYSILRLFRHTIGDTAFQDTQINGPPKDEVFTGERCEGCEGRGQVVHG